METLDGQLVLSIKVNGIFLELFIYEEYCAQNNPKRVTNYACRASYQLKQVVFALMENI